MPKIEFDNPPVVETVLGLQFAAIEGFTAAHAGIFFEGWLKPSDSKWRNAKIVEATRLPETEEQFGDLNFRPQPSIQLRTSNEPDRIMITRSDQERLIQLQDTRIVYNWRKRTGDYPSYEVLKPEFDSLVEVFSRFLSENGFTPFMPNLWEIANINHIPKGELWTKVADWSEVFPNLYIPNAVQGAPVSFESMNGGWRYILERNSGRLHLTLQHGQTPARTEVIILQLLVRGPIEPSQSMTADVGFEVGHNIIVNTFARITSPRAHSVWKVKSNV